MNVDNIRLHAIMFVCIDNIIFGISINIRYIMRDQYCIYVNAVKNQMTYGFAYDKYAFTAYHRC